MLSSDQPAAASGSPEPASPPRAPSPPRAVVSASDTAAALSLAAGPPSPSPPSKRARTDGGPDGDDEVIAAATVASASAAAAAAADSPYTELQRSVHAALDSKDGPALTTSDKVALALEVLRARQLELDIAQARDNIEALVTKRGSGPRTLRSVIPASTVKGLPVGTPLEITAGKFILSPTTNDPRALFLTLELQSFGQPAAGSAEEQGENAAGGE